MRANVCCGLVSAVLVMPGANPRAAAAAADIANAVLDGFDGILLG
jgi:phosphatidylserine synthase